MRDLAGKRREAEMRGGRGPRTQRVQPNRVSGRITPSNWIVTSFILVPIIICYLIFTVQTPAAIESMMEEWAQLFD